MITDRRNTSRLREFYNTHICTTGILSGDYELSTEGKCVISGLPADTHVLVGDPVLTSGAGDIYPRGLAVGVVTDIIKDPYTQTATLAITPYCDLVNEESVMVITDFERLYEKPSDKENALDKVTE